jgi:hypothetical protein
MSFILAHVVVTVYGKVLTLEQHGVKLRVCPALVRLYFFISGQTNSKRFIGTYAPNPSDSSGINSDKIGISWVTFDTTSGSAGQATSRIFVGVADVGRDNIYMSTDAGSTCALKHFFTV